MRKYGTIPSSFWIDEIPPKIKGNPLAIAMVAYLMSSPHSNMIGIYRLPMAYVRVDTGFSDSLIHDAFHALEEADFAFYDESTQFVYIPTYAATQVAPSLTPRDNRHPAVQREVNLIQHEEFKKRFLERYAKLFNLRVSEAPSEGPAGGSEGAPSPSRGTPEGLPPRKAVDNQGASKGLGRDPVPVPVSVIAPDDALEKGVKRGLGREEGKPRRSRAHDFFAAWPDYMMRQNKLH